MYRALTHRPSPVMSLRRLVKQTTLAALAVALAAVSSNAPAYYNVTIANCAASSGGSWSGTGTTASPRSWTPSASGSTVCVSDIVGNGGFDVVTAVKIAAGVAATGTEPGAITVATPLEWTQPGKTLLLTAAQDVNINANISANSATGALRLAFGSGRNYVLGSGVKINLPAGVDNLIVSGVNFTVITALGAEGSTTGTDLQGMSGALATQYALGADIDASATATWNGGAGFLPVGTDSNRLTGRLHGLGHTISNLTINRPATDYVGLIGSLGALSVNVVRDVALVGGSVTGRAQVGALAGNTQSGSTVRGVTVSVDVTSTNSPATGVEPGTGGLIGRALGAVSDSAASGAVTATTDRQVGGLVGYSVDAVTNSSASGQVVGASEVGGLIGAAQGFGYTVANAHASGNVSASGGSVGGLIGDSLSDVTGSFATGTVSGADAVGGLAGYGRGRIQNSYATGAVSGSGGGVGGLVGILTGSQLDAAYATGAVSAGANAYSVGGLAGSINSSSQISGAYARGKVTGGAFNIGGLVGSSRGKVTASYAQGDVNAPGATYVGGLIGLATRSAADATPPVNLSFAAGNVTGGFSTGGLVGSARDIFIADVYASGNVSGTSQVGGVIGRLEQAAYSAALRRAYSTGSVTASLAGSVPGGLIGVRTANTDVADTYWSSAASGVPAGVGNGAAAGAADLTATQLKQQGSYANFDFAANTGVWRIYTAQTTPLLRQFLRPLTLTADNVSKSWDGVAVTALSNLSYNPVSALGSADVMGLTPAYGSDDTTAAGSHSPQVYSHQFGYDITMNGGVLTVAAPSLKLDVDASSSATKYQATTDGLLVLRHLLGLSGASLVTGATGGTATRSAAVIRSYLSSVGAGLDVDGNGNLDAATDGLLVLRYLFGFRGTALIDQAVGACPPATTCRSSAADIETYLAGLVP